MSTAASDLLHFLADRGHNPTCTDEAGLTRELGKGVVTGYCGFDATADSLHIGNLVQLMFLRRLQMAGHRPIVLMGGATTKVGDPSGKDESRPLLTPELIAGNIASIQRGLSRFIRFDSSTTGAIIVNNDDWLGSIGYIDLLREVGAHFTINRMLTMESVKLRLDREQPLTFLEFNYMIMQGYDFVELKKRYNCILQMAGMDQWGNVVQGIELGRRQHGYELYGVVQPLLTTATGAKMGKSVGGAVWINANRRSPYDFWQYWRNCEDADVGRWLRLFTDLPIDEVKRLETLQDREINDAKKVLATEVTALVHGREAAEAAAQTAQATFEQGTLGGELKRIPVEESWTAVEVSVACGFATSKSEARRLIEGGGLKVNDEPIMNPTLIIGSEYFTDGTAKFSKGKKQHVVGELKKKSGA